MNKRLKRIKILKTMQALILATAAISSLVFAGKGLACCVSNSKIKNEIAENYRTTLVENAQTLDEQNKAYEMDKNELLDEARKNGDEQMQEDFKKVDDNDKSSNRAALSSGLFGIATAYSAKTLFIIQKKEDALKMRSQETP